MSSAPIQPVGMHPVKGALIKGEVRTGLSVAAMAGTALLAGCGGSDTANLGRPVPSAFDSPERARPNSALLRPRRSLAANVQERKLSANEFMDWAQDAFSEYFPSRQADQTHAQFVYRFYPDSGNYLGVANGRVYVLGPSSGGELVDVGLIANFAPYVFTEPRPVSLADATAARALLQTQFSASIAEIDEVRKLGFGAWLEQQLASSRSISGVAWLDANGYDDTSGQKQFITTDFPSNHMIWNQMWTAPDAVRMRAALALSEFFVISSSGFNALWKCYSVAAFWDVLVGNAFGNFRALLEQVSLSSAMGSFLSVIGSRKEDDSGRQPDENYAREVMQLFTIGLYELNIDGTEKVDANGQRIETISNDDVTNLARVFTGFTFALSPGPARVSDDVVHKLVPDTIYVTAPMRLNPSEHSTLACTFLGKTIAAGTDGKTALSAALDTLFRHPNVGPFFARQMIQRLITSNPSPAFVKRVATVFNANDRGVRGDLKAVFRAIWMDPEARSPGSTDAARMGKLREPMIRLAQWGRSFAAVATRNQWKSFSNAFEYGQQLPLNGPSVFNFFRPGYVPPNTALASSAWVAPEFQIVDESSVAEYLNYIQTVIRSGFNVMQTDKVFAVDGSFVGSPQVRLQAEYVEERRRLGITPALVQYLNLVLCAGSLPDAVQRIIISALDAMPSAGLPDSEAATDRVAAAVFMVMATPEYLVQR